MEQSLTLGGVTSRRALSLLSGLGMAVFSVLTIEHYYAANFPESIFEGSFCDINAFFNCDLRLAYIKLFLVFTELYSK